MDNTEQAFNRIAAEIGTLASPPTRLHRTTQAAGEFLLYLTALAITAGLFIVFGAAARIGWEWMG